MRLFSIYPFFMILLSLFLFACDVHEWPDETSEPPKPDHVIGRASVGFHLRSGRASRL